MPGQRSHTPSRRRLMGAAMMVCAALYSVGMMGCLPTWRPLPPLAGGTPAARLRGRGEATRARQLSDSGAAAPAAAEEGEEAADSSNRSSSSGKATVAATRTSAFEAAAAAAVPAGAGVHGFVHKAGPLDIRSWHSSHREWRER